MDLLAGAPGDLENNLGSAFWIWVPLLPTQVSESLAACSNMSITIPSFPQMILKATFIYVTLQVL